MKCKKSRNSNWKHALFSKAFTLCVFVLTVMFIPEIISGQVDSLSESVTANISKAGVASNMERADSYDPEDYEGSAFLSRDWKTGVVFTEGQYYGHFAIKVNLINNSLVFLIDGQELELGPEYYEHFGLANESTNELAMFFKTDDFSFKKRPFPSLVEQITFGDYDLYVVYEGGIRKPNENTVIMGGDARMKLDVKQRFYIDKSGKLILLRNRKDVIENLDRRKRRKIEKYVKEQKLKFKTKDDFLLLFNYLSPKSENEG